MDVFTDAGAGIRLRPGDLALVLQEHLELFDQLHAAGATNAELRGLVAELRQLRNW